MSHNRFVWCFTFMAIVFIVSPCAAQPGEIWDANAEFDRIAKGENVIVLDEVQYPLRPILEMFADDVGIRGGRITRYQFTSRFGSFRSTLMSKLNDPEYMRRFNERRKQITKDLMNNNESFQEKVRDQAKESAERNMKLFDRDKSGFLEKDELQNSPKLREHFDFYDKNRDGRISLLEYETYRAAMITQTLPDNNDNSKEETETVRNLIIIREPDPRRPKVHRPGSLPDGLPPWFEEADTIKADGQVSLFEWRSLKKPIAEFVKMDRNNDGFITPNELVSASTRRYTASLRRGDPLDTVRRSSYCRIYEEDLSADSKYTIDMVGNFDCFLRIEDAKGKNLAQNDDGGDGLNSRIVFTPPSDGKYKVIATSCNGNAVGDFTLTIRGEKKFFAEKKQTFTGRLTTNDNTDGSRNGCFFKPHVVTMKARHTYVIDMVANFDTFLRLEDSKGRRLAQDDDGGNGLNSRITFRAIADGDYRIIATSCSPGTTGSYALTILEQ